MPSPQKNIKTHRHRYVPVDLHILRPSLWHPSGSYLWALVRMRFLSLAQKCRNIFSHLQNSGLARKVSSELDKSRLPCGTAPGITGVLHAVGVQVDFRQHHFPLAQSIPPTAFPWPMV